MRAVVWDGGLTVRDDVPIPERRQGEALIRVTLAGVCNTDIEITRGYTGFKGVLGHEFVGIVEATDDPDLVGRRVVGEINVPCGECEMCRRGYPRHCDRRRTLGIHGLNGAFADYTVLPEGNLHVLPDEVSDRQAVFVEPLAAGVEILDQVHIRPEDKVVVLGDGKLGLLAAMAIRAYGHDVVVVGRHPEKLAIARAAGVAGVTEGEFAGRADVVVECTGSPSGVAAALAIVRPRGTLVLKTTVHGQTSVDLSRIVVNEIACVGSRCGPFAPAIRLIAEGKINTEGLIDSVFPASRAHEAMARAQTRGVLKVLLDFRL